MVNYIHHIEGAMDHFRTDQRITPWHISLYFALFQIWNNVRFKEEINIRREELMELSKIGSANTYTKCLKELSQWNYIKYTPSKSRFKSSKVHMYRFDNTSDTTPDNTSDKSPVHLVRPFLNTSKHIENSKGVSHTPETLQSSEVSHSPSSSSKKKTFKPPELEETKTFFQENKSTGQEAQKFFNHFESNGWKVGGKTPMKNWKAAARNWILRSDQFNSKKQNRLQTNENKDYDIPL